MFLYHQRGLGNAENNCKQEKNKQAVLFILELPVYLTLLEHLFTSLLPAEGKGGVSKSDRCGQKDALRMRSQSKKSSLQK